MVHAKSQTSYAKILQFNHTFYIQKMMLPKIQGGKIWYVGKNIDYC